MSGTSSWHPRKERMKACAAHNPQPSYTHPRHRRARKPKRIGFDLHGVIDTHYAFFRKFLRDLIRQGWEVHIITGAQWSKERKKLRRLGIPFTHFFSIVDHHQSIGTKLRWDKKGNAHLDPSLWDRTKALYCREQKIGMHFDDSDIYGLFFKTPYVRYFSKSSPRVKKIHI